MRHLVSTRRTVTEDRLEEYRACWSELRAAVEARGGHAWIFRSDERRDRFIEFIEYGDGADPREDAAVRAAAERVHDAAGAGVVEAWTAVEDDR